MNSPEQSEAGREVDYLGLISDRGRDFINALSNSSMEGILFTRKEVLKLIVGNENLNKERRLIMSALVDLQIIQTKQDERKNERK